MSFAATVCPWQEVALEQRLQKQRKEQHDAVQRAVWNANRETEWNQHFCEALQAAERMQREAREEASERLRQQQIQQERIAARIAERIAEEELQASRKAEEKQKSVAIERMILDLTNDENVQDDQVEDFESASEWEEDEKDESDDSDSDWEQDEDDDSDSDWDGDDDMDVDAKSVAVIQPGDVVVDAMSVENSALAMAPVPVAAPAKRVSARVLVAQVLADEPDGLNRLEIMERVRKIDPLVKHNTLCGAITVRNTLIEGLGNSIWRLRK